MSAVDSGVFPTFVAGMCTSNEAALVNHLTTNNFGRYEVPGYGVIRHLANAGRGSPRRLDKDSRDPKGPMLRGQLRTVTQIQAVCQAITTRGCHGDDGEELRDKAIFILLTGMRPEEALRVRFDWIEPAPPDTGVAAVLRFPDEAAKTYEGGGTIGLSDLAMEVVLRRYRGDPHETIFRIKRHKTQLRRISEELGIDPPFKLRDMRTTHLTWAKERAGIDAAQAAGRHTHPRTTMAYVRQHALNLDALKAACAVTARFQEGELSQASNTGRPLLPSS